MASIDMVTTTVYNSTYIPFDLYIIIFIATLVFLGMSIIVKHNSKILLGAIATLFAFFITYSTFVLGKTTDTQLIFNNTTNEYVYYTLDTIYTVQPMLFLCIGLCAVCVFNLWMSVFYTIENQLTEAVDENKDVKAPYLKSKKEGD
ncbi:MAG: hypothetical protein M0R51_14445 [Clostridia bacterium]|jgi:hypothetical protein|nr:hypothetical protein [Clostridia bacterium]